ncbi:hypothetical protein BN946_scf185036.g4 [Trametes cinnabarina]|uniref:Uncharacterized protein n=1 Tax=Pycnoporus cinnabarinus TaxID=5643 RepID=A0A060SLG4_PYCCI|nr:hypothetical protein BN946_scf185036.g4 [Trametes cinnabarina]
MPAHAAVAVRWHALILHLQALSFWTIAICTPPPTWAAAVNRTIDDQFGDSVTRQLPSYQPDGKWAQGSQCSGCALNSTNIALSEVFSRTWHDSICHPGEPDRVISVVFRGTAAHVFNLIANDFGGVSTPSNLTFSLDNELVGAFLHEPVPNRNSVMFQQAVYVNESLDDENHSFEIRMNGPTPSLILFDFIVYTSIDSDESSTSPSNSSNTSNAPSQCPFPHLPSQPSDSTRSAQPSAPIGTIVGGSSS